MNITDEELCAHIRSVAAEERRHSDYAIAMEGFKREGSTNREIWYSRAIIAIDTETYKSESLLDEYERADFRLRFLLHRSDDILPHELKEFNQCVRRVGSLIARHEEKTRLNINDLCRSVEVLSEPIDHLRMQKPPAMIVTRSPFMCEVVNFTEEESALVRYMQTQIRKYEEQAVKRRRDLIMLERIALLYHRMFKHINRHLKINEKK